MGSSLLPSYETTVTAGELVTFNIIGLDSNLYNGVIPQDLTMEISGGQIIDPSTGTCSNPPCATFLSTSGMPPPIISPGIVEGVFEWQTSCDHVSSDIACGRTTNLYQFSVKVFDDFCPAPAIRNVTLMIYVEADNQLSVSEIQPSCFGNDGVITLSPSLSITQVAWDAELFDLSGNLVSGSYNILSNTYSLLNLSNGDYVVRASGAGGCIVEDSIVLLEAPNPLLVEYNVSHVSCYGGSDGEIGVDLSNGLSPYTFYINGVENVISPPYDSLFTNLSEGVYIITGIDSDSCGVVETIFIDAPAFPLQVLSSNSITICDTSSEGSAVAYAAGGSPYPDGSYNFEWFTDSWGSLGVGDSIDNLGVGNYYLEVTDSNFCQSHIPINVYTAQLPLFISPQLFGVVCTGDSSGSAVVFSGGGTAPYDYEWSTLVGYVLSTSFGVIDRDTLSDLLAGSYHLSITDASGCMDEMTFNIDEPLVRLEISEVLVVDSIDCHGDFDGRAIVYMINGSGSPAYSYLWDNGETTALANSLSGGWHTVEVSDTRGCLVVDSVFIPENDIIKSDLSIIVPVSCYGYSDGEIGVNTVGGIPFVASPGYEYFWSNGVQPNFDFIDNLSHGSYYLTTRDALGCVVVDSIYLPEPDPLYVTAQEILRVSCYEDSTGTAYAVGMGGTAPYDFTWQNNIISSVSNDSSIVYTLFAGLETVVLEDSRGCISSDTVLIHQPDELIVSISDSVFAYCIGVNTASATASVIGGTSPYTYEWNDNNVVPQTTITASDLDAGIYMVTVQDSRGCLDSVNVVLDSVTSVMEVNISSLSAGGNSVSCYGSDDGELTVEVFSGTSPYTYQWVGPTGVSSNDTIFNLTSGNYSVTVTDVNGCVVNTNKVLTEPDPLLYKVLSTTASTCLGSCDGVVELYIEGGIPPYNAQLINNQTSTVAVDTAVVALLVTDVCTGDYTVLVSDSNMCDAVLLGGGSSQALLDATITTDVAVSQQSISCYGDSTGVISINNPQIGALYSYLWENLNGDTIGITTTVDSLLAGDYILYSSYSNIDGCTTRDTVTVLQNSLVHSAVILINVSCNGLNDGEIETTTFGGVSPYTYSWTPQSGTTSNLDSLSAGTYNLSIEDSNGCDVIESYQVGEPSEVEVNVTTSQGYILTANASGGTPPYSYSWEEQSTANSLGAQQTYTVVSNGIYYVVVTDANGCIETSGDTEFDETTGLINTVGGIALNIYPNPFKDETTVDFGREVNRATITIVDVYGKLIETYNVTNQQTQIIKRNNKASGVYFLEIEMEGQNINSKIILK
ncbi:MAG: T9SS type A sorting domain-containing protein, partial [Flavobacteriales bacterium]|nr:T9SS type A sorting domain-containing protein [Flavobacteriales bacterium]